MYLVKYILKYILRIDFFEFLLDRFTEIVAIIHEYIWKTFHVVLMISCTIVATFISE